MNEAIFFGSGGGTSYGGPSKEPREFDLADWISCNDDSSMMTNGAKPCDFCFSPH
ncbi:MAG: hypothetical protein LBB34_00800 [Holosporales bacterium]|nr:hypothetical protein [Holosporales bacterium]